MRPFMGSRARADAYPPGHDGNDCRFNYSNPGIGGSTFRGPRPPFRGRGADRPFDGRFFQPHGPRWPQMFRGGPPFPWAGQMPHLWRPPFRPMHRPLCTEPLSRDHSGAQTTSWRGDWDNSDVEHLQYAGSYDRSEASQGTQPTGSESLRDAEHRSSTSGRVEMEAKRKMHEPRKRSINNEYRRARSRSSRSSTSSPGNRTRERRRSRERKYAAKSRDNRKVRKRARTRSRSPYERRRRKRSESRTRVRATSRCKRDARGGRKRSPESTARMCIFPQSKQSAAYEQQEMAERSAGISGIPAYVEENPSYSVTASSKKDVPRKEDCDDTESPSSAKEAMLGTREVSPPQVPLVKISPRGSSVGLRGDRDEGQGGLGTEVYREGGGNLVKAFVRPSLEDYRHASCSKSQPGWASPDSTANLLQVGLTSLKKPSEVISAEGEEIKLAVSGREEVVPSARVDTDDEDVDREAISSEGAVAEKSGVGPTKSVVESALAGSSRSPPCHLGQHINRERDQVDNGAKQLACSSTAGGKCVTVVGEAVSSGTVTPTHCSNDSSGGTSPPVLLAMLRKTGSETREPGRVLQEQPSHLGVSTQAPICINVQMPRSSPATCVNVEAPSTSRAAYFRADVDPDAETQSIASTPTLHHDVWEVSSSSEAPEVLAPQEDCYITCAQGLSAPAESCLPSGECSLPGMLSGINTAWFPSLESVQEYVLYQEDTYTACLILDLLRDAQRKSQVLSMYEEGLHTGERAACSAHMRRIVFDAIESQRGSRMSFARKLPKFANF